MVDITLLSLGLSITSICFSIIFSLIGIIIALKTLSNRFKPYLVCNIRRKSKYFIFTYENVGNGPAIKIFITIKFGEATFTSNLKSLHQGEEKSINLPQYLAKEKISDIILIYYDIKNNKFKRSTIDYEREEEFEDEMKNIFA